MSHTQSKATPLFRQRQLRNTMVEVLILLAIMVGAHMVTERSSVDDKIEFTTAINETVNIPTEDRISQQ